MLRIVVIVFLVFLNSNVFARDSVEKIISPKVEIQKQLDYENNSKKLRVIILNVWGGHKEEKYADYILVSLKIIVNAFKVMEDVVSDPRLCTWKLMYLKKIWLIALK